MRVRTLIAGLGVVALAGAVALLRADHPLGGRHRRTACSHANLANGETLFQHRRLRLVPCHAETGRQAPAGRRPGAGDALRHLQGAQHLVRSSGHGIGAWTEAAFVNAMLRGVGRNGEHLYPAFPYTSYQRMSARRRARPVRLPEDAARRGDAVRAASAAFPFNVRRGLGLWKLLYLDGKTFTARSRQER